MTNDQAFLLFSPGHSSHASLNVSMSSLFFFSVGRTFYKCCWLPFPTLRGTDACVSLCSVDLITHKDKVCVLFFFAVGGIRKLLFFVVFFCFAQMKDNFFTLVSFPHTTWDSTLRSTPSVYVHLTPILWLTWQCNNQRPTAILLAGPPSHPPVNWRAKG